MTLLVETIESSESTIHSAGCCSKQGTIHSAGQLSPNCVSRCCCCKLTPALLLLDTALLTLLLLLLLVRSTHTHTDGCVSRHRSIHVYMYIHTCCTSMGCVMGNLTTNTQTRKQTHTHTHTHTHTDTDMRTQYTHIDFFLQKHGAMFNVEEAASSADSTFSPSQILPNHQKSIISSNQIKSNQIKSNQIKSNQIKSNQITSHQ